jgi:hypothetical protein
MLGPLSLFRIARAVRFLFLGPFILALCFVINWMTFQGEWWVRWVALGIGIAWVVCLLRVLRAVILLGGIAALVAWLAKGRTQNS